MLKEETGLLAATIRRPVTVIVGCILVVLFGAVAIFDLPIQLTPDIERPTINITTRWRGATPIEVEAQILNEQEEVLQGISGLRKMDSEAAPDQGMITLEFEVGTDIDEALVRSSNRLSQVGNYPDSADQPVIETANVGGAPLAVIAVRSPTGAPVAAYRTWVEQRILPEIERIPGVSSIRFLGGQDTRIDIDFDAAELVARGITLQQLISRVRSELADTSGGDITLGKRRLLIRTLAAPNDPRELEALILGAGSDGTPIRLGDVAKVRYGLRKATSVAMNDNRPSLILLLSREAGSNVLVVSREIRQKVKELAEGVFAREGLEFEVLSDQTDYIVSALDLVRQNLLLGALLASIVLLIFLRSFRASLVVSIAIPVCVLGTALGMQLVGRTVNIVSLAGITFAVGMVLDNSIVALESIYSELGVVKVAAKAAHKGVGRVWGAILASTATTTAVFVPVIGWQGEVGQLLRDVAIAISFAVIISLFVSVWAIPSLAAQLLKKPVSEDRFAGLAHFGERMRDGITTITQWLVAKSWRSIFVVSSAMLISSAIAWFMLPPFEYLPAGNRNLVFGILVPPPGVSLEELDSVGRQVQSEIKKHQHKSVGGYPSVERSFFVGTPNTAYSGGLAEDPTRVKDMLPLFSKVHSSIPGMISFTTQASLFSRGGDGNRSIDIDILGSDLGELGQVGGMLFASLMQSMPGAQMRPLPSLDSGTPELHWYPRRDQSAGLSIDATELGRIVDTYADGSIVGELSVAGESLYDVVVRARKRNGDLYETNNDLLAAPVIADNGAITTLGAVAESKEELGPTVIRRIERRRAITLRVSPPDDLALEDAIRHIKEKAIAPMAAKHQIPANVDLELSGTASDLDIARDRFAMILLLALIICFLLLAALFENFLAPVVILTTVPLAAAGGVLGLRFVDAFLAPQPLDLMTAMGFLILIGVVVNNAILVVEEALFLLREGHDLTSSIVQGVKSRIRPIFMTTFTSLAGLTPMVLFPGSGSELYRGVGAIVLGGLALSSVLTLFIVPALFVLLWRTKAQISEKVLA
ncbi:MAG: efflux RND transporter permease subunit [Myxococcales bacterium]|nr:MAG: efflux RND transporter permease subunit [Myxococcales bacterium]